MTRLDVIQQRIALRSPRTSVGYKGDEGTNSTLFLYLAAFVLICIIAAPFFKPVEKQFTVTLW